MNIDAFDYLLDKLISIRNLTLTPDQRGAWWETLQDVEGPVFKEAVRRMIQEDESYPTPAHARRICSEITSERLSRVTQPPPPSGLTREEYSRWNHEWRRQIKRGESPEQAQHLAVEASKGVAQIEAVPRTIAAGSQGAPGGVVVRGDTGTRPPTSWGP